MSGNGSRALEIAARVVSIISIVVAALLVISIVLIIVAPNLDPFPVGYAFDVGDRLAGPFDGVFFIRNVGAYVAANWGLAAVVWLILGQLIALGLRRAARSVGPGRAQRSEGA